jgi:hypothetical protein
VRILLAFSVAYVAIVFVATLRAIVSAVAAAAACELFVEA